MAATTALREALNRGISSGGLVDTKIILYSHRDYSGRVRRPKALYTNSRVLKTVPYFNDLLFGNFAESQSKDFKEAIDEEEYAEDYGYISDSDLEDDEEDKFSFVYNGKPKVYHPSDPFAIPGEDKVACADYEECVEEGKVVKVPDIAFVTFQAFIMYLYTGVIEFAPFGSEEIRRSRKAEIVRSSDDKIPRPSPKSIYRLADKYDIPALKTLALSHIRSGLAKCDIVEESFSIFASRYDEVRKLYIDQLAFVWMEDSTAEATRARVEEKIDGFAEGDYDHAADTLSALWEIATKDGDAKAPSTATPAATPVTSPENWALVNKALIKSIRRGVFFDKKYWARHSKTGEIFKPVYFSSIIMNDKAPQLDKIVKYLKDEDPLMSDLKGQINIESDCDQADREAAEQREKERWRRNQEAKEAEERRLRNREAKEAEERRLRMDRAASWGLEPQVSQYRPEPPKPQPWGDWFTPSTLETAKGVPVGGWLRTSTETAGLQPERSLTPTEVTLPSSDRKPAPAPALPGPSTPISTVSGHYFVHISYGRR
ncbi:hypothetical protein BJ322DRAFT_829047 [Thelephora terrestris]|uniref:BTB domain-containing protein n=1 Tax=Thelephora terrestris TaxID=56493 RepID=A0A9P6HEU2_9AGAM|nr:hypothetical protein BJ322DRAFT_829047 [Thelephora terrestris]